MHANIYCRILLLFVTILGACVSDRRMAQVPSNSEQLQDDRATQAYREKVESLQVDLAALNRQSDLLEARQVAVTAIQYASYLADQYRVVRPAVLHNVLVRLGVKDRGLCHHWTEDLMHQLEQLDLKNYQLYWGVAHRGSELREHNSVVVAAKGRRFEEGIVLNPWRKFRPIILGPG